VCLSLNSRTPNSVLINHYIPCETYPFSTRTAFRQIVPCITLVVEMPISYDYTLLLLYPLPSLTHNPSSILHSHNRTLSIPNSFQYPLSKFHTHSITYYQSISITSNTPEIKPQVFNPKTLCHCSIEFLYQLHSRSNVTTPDHLPRPSPCFPSN